MAEETQNQEAAKPESAPAAAEKAAAAAGAADTKVSEAAAPGERPPADSGPGLAAGRRGRGRGRHIPPGVANIKATFNNIMVSITDVSGGVIAWCSGGRAGFKGSRKSTAFAATLVAQDAARQAIGKGMHEVEVRVQGAGSGRESAVRGLQSAGLGITVIRDVTPIPHNGCRPRKRRRV